MLKKTGELIRRRVAVLLAVLMALSCLPMPVLADEQKTETEPEEAITELAMPRADAELPPVSPQGASETGSGTCGENLTWSLANGVLTISGEGAMDNYTYKTPAPWDENRLSIQCVVIEEGVTSIGRFAFQNCRALTSAEIPDGVTVIGQDAFSQCLNLSSITIPNSVTAIESDVFSGCSSLTHVVFPQHSVKLGNFVFWRCDALADENGFVIFNDVLFYYAGKDGEVTIPDGIGEINGGAFQFKDYLTKVTIPKSVTDIEFAAFRQDDNLTDIMYLGTKKDWSSVCVKEENDALFVGVIHCTDGDYKYDTSGNCGEKLAWKIEDGLLIISGEGAMSDYYRESPPWYNYKSVIEGIAIENGVETVGAFAFEGCTKVASVRLPDSLTSIEYYAFCDSARLTNVIYDGTKEEWNAIAIDNTDEGNAPLLAAKITCTDGVVQPVYSGECGDDLTWTLEGDVLTISGTGPMYDSCEWWNYRDKITEVVIEDGVTTIGRWAFQYHPNLRTVRMADSVESIGAGAFHECKKLTDTGVPENLTDIGEDAYRGCDALADANGFVIVNGILFDYVGEAEKVSIPAYVTRISRYSFWDCQSVKEVTIPSGINSVVYGMFSGCENLVSVSLPDSITKIELSAFYGCKNLELTLPDSVTEVEDLAFKGCEKMADEDGFVSVLSVLFDYVGDSGNVVIPDEISTISPSAFAYGKLSSVTIPTNVKRIGFSAFNECNDLADVYYLGTQSEWNQITIENSNKAIYNAVIHCADGIVDSFHGECGNGLTWTLMDGVLTVSGEGDMGNWYSWQDFGNMIHTVVIEDGVTSIAGAAWSNCSILTSISIPGTVKQIRWNAFWQCDNLSDVYFFGDEEDWNSIEIYGNNDCLTNAAIHYITSSEIEPIIVEGNTITTLIAPVCDTVDKPTAWCVVYDAEGRMLWAKQKSLTANQMNELTFELEDGAASVKVLALTGDFAPLCTYAEGVAID